MNKILICGLLFFGLCGCIHKEINIQVTKPYEGHYFTTNDFYKATKNILLLEDESIWVLSNTTLKQLLKNTGK